MGRFLIKPDVVKIAARALLSTTHPILVHIVAMRRCNLACKYCNEFDAVSQPVPADIMFKRIDKLAEFRTSIVTFSGGEPLLHPDLDRLIERVVSHGMLPELLTNGFMLAPDRILRLNRAGLRHLQISVDNVQPDDVSKKSLKTLEPRLRDLAKYAKFDININSVVGGGTANPDDALTIARRARELGFTSSVGIIHDGHGQLRPLGERERAIYDEISSYNPPALAIFSGFRKNLVEGKPNAWRCRAGARYMYICEHGLVHRCSQQRGTPGVPLLTYTQEMMNAEYNTPKGCAPMCTITCVHSVAVFDNWRAPQEAYPGAVGARVR